MSRDRRVDIIEYRVFPDLPVAGSKLVGKLLEPTASPTRVDDIVQSVIAKTLVSNRPTRGGARFTSQKSF